MSATSDRPEPRNPSLPSPSLPPLPPGHKTVESLFAEMMLASFGHHWKWQLPRHIREHSRDFFYSGFIAFVGAICDHIEPIQQHLTPEFAASLIHWQEEISAYAAEVEKRMRRGG